MRLGEQIFEIDVPLTELALDDPKLMAAVRAFHRRHEELYGYSYAAARADDRQCAARYRDVLPSVPREPVLQRRGGRPSGERKAYLSGWVPVRCTTSTACRRAR